MNDPIPTIRAFYEIQEEAASKLRADPYFADVEVVTENQKDFLNKIDIKLKTLGIVCVVALGLGKTINPQIGGGKMWLDEIDISIHFEENILINRYGASGTKKPVQEAVLVGLILLHHYRVTYTGQLLVVDSPGTAPAEPVAAAANMAYSGFLKTKALIEYPLVTA